MIRQTVRFGGSGQRPGRPHARTADPGAQAAAALADVGTEAIVLRIWEAIW
jgi:hypothetical protein